MFKKKWISRKEQGVGGAAMPPDGLEDVTLRANHAQ
jgi:hypothetical protein